MSPPMLEARAAVAEMHRVRRRLRVLKLAIEGRAGTQDHELVGFAEELSRFVEGGAAGAAGAPGGGESPGVASGAPSAPGWPWGGINLAAVAARRQRTELLLEYVSRAELGMLRQRALASPRPGGLGWHRALELADLEVTICLDVDMLASLFPLLTPAEMPA